MTKQLKISDTTPPNRFKFRAWDSLTEKMYYFGVDKKLKISWEDSGMLFTVGDHLCEPTEWKSLWPAMISRSDTSRIS